MLSSEIHQHLLFWLVQKLVQIFMAKITLLELKNLTVSDHGKMLPDGDSVFAIVRSGTRGISASFVLKYKFDNQRRDLRLGTWPKDGLKEIRAEATSARMLLTQGVDPSVARHIEKKSARHEQATRLAELEAIRTGLTLKQLVDLWIERDRKTAVKDGGLEVRRSFSKDLLPELGSVLIKDLTRGKIAVLLDRVKARSPMIARYLLADLRSMFKWAILRDYVDSDPTHLLELKKYATKNERERVLSEDEIRELVNKLPTAQLPVHTVQAVWLMLATCCRVGEISQAKWSDVDLDKRQWRIPAPNSKNGKPLTIILSDFAVERFKAIRAEQQRQLVAWERKTLPAFVIPSDDWSTHIDVKAVSKQIKDRQRDTPLKGRVQRANKALILSSSDGWTPHDLRRTGATLMRSLKVDGDTIEACLNHVKKETLKRIYQRPDLSHEMAQAWTVLGQRLELLNGYKQNVVILNRA